MQGFESQKSQIDARIKAGHFLQSKEWEEFQRALGREVFRLGDVLFVKLPLALGRSYFYAGGFDLRFKIHDLRILSKQHKAVFLKVEPMMEIEGLADKLIEAGFVKSKKEVQPQKTIVLDLTKSEEELLAGMHQKTRYNIRLAEKKELRIINHESGITDDEVFEGFWRLLQKTAKRDDFFTHQKQYYKKFIESFRGHNFLFVIHNSRSEMIAAHIVLFHNDTAYYLHGASDYEYRNLMAPYVLHWETIKYAKSQGYKKYDFWGIDEKKWPGVTRFKRGFDGKEINYIGSFDYIFQPFWYRIYNLRNKLKGLR